MSFWIRFQLKKIMICLLLPRELPVHWNVWFEIWLQDTGYTSLHWIPSSSWLSHQMETFSALLAICAGNSSGTGEFPTQRPVTRSFDVFFDLHPNKRLSKQWWGWWFETPPCPLQRHRNDFRNKNTGYVNVNQTTLSLAAEHWAHDY